jgi:arabinogalactan endo-1,4-beta-galactosidase
LGVLSAACDPETSTQPTTTGGSPGSGGQPGSGGTAPASGGAANVGGSSTGGTATGGKATGGSSTGGTATGGSAGGSSPAYMPAFIIGADISHVQQQEAGMTFKDVNGTAPSGTTSTGGGMLTILKNHGFNYVRLTLFVNPAASGGYSSQGYCDLAHTITFGAGVKRAGMGFLLDLQLSDNFANPGTQTKPAAWANLSFADLTTQLYNYTKDVITQLKANNARPDMVQIGNEIPSGLLFDASGAVGGNGGKVSGQQFGNLGTLLKAGISGVKDVDSNIKIMLHLDRCHDLAVNTWWLEGVWGQGVEFDILGESCYDVTGYQQPASSWPGVFSSIIANGTGSNTYASKYANLLFVAVEYSPSKQLVNDTIYNLPNKRGLGAFVFEPTLAGNVWSEPMFNTGGTALSQYMTIYENIAATYGQR